MKAEYKQKLPQWYTSKVNHDLIITDDIDSLMSCAILQKVNGWEIKYCMLFKADTDKNFDFMGKTSDATNEVVGVDLALQQNQKCFDNHLSRCVNTDPVNENCINPNMFSNISRGNYFKKYNLSTVLLVWSIYDIPLPKSEEGKMILLTIDSSYYSHFSKYQNDRDMNKHYMCDVLGLEELYECQLRHTKREFEAIERKYKLKEKIKSVKGVLHTDIDLIAINLEVGLDTDIWCELPTVRFRLFKKFRDIQSQLYPNTIYSTKLADISKNPFSVALTGQNYICYSQEIIESEE